MNRKEAKLSPIKIVAVILIGLALAFISFLAVLAIIYGFEMKEKTPKREIRLMAYHLQTSVPSG